MKRFLLSVICAAVCLTAGAQDIKYFKLNNGMSVYIWEDHTKPDVSGEVAWCVRSEASRVDAGVLISVALFLGWCVWRVRTSGLSGRNCLLARGRMQHGCRFPQLVVSGKARRAGDMPQIPGVALLASAQ